MTTAVTATTLNCTTTAGFRLWVAEIITQLLAVGLTQTSDTGQINTSTVSLPSPGTIGGYTIWRFNDTLQATYPIFIKIEFGQTSTTGCPWMLVTVGSASNGSGTITQAAGGIPVSTRVVCNDNQIPTSTASPYVSRFCYDTVTGVLWFGTKYGHNATNNIASVGLIVARTMNSSGVPTGDAVAFISNATSAAAGGYYNGAPLQVLSALTGLPYPSTAGGNTNYGLIPQLVTASAYAGALQQAPAIIGSPVWQVMGNIGFVFPAELPLHATWSLAVLGSTPITWIQAGYTTGSSTMLAVSTGPCFALPWQ